jgi:hypothetical protein
MANTTFTDANGNVPGTVVVAAWLNDVNDVAYDILGDGTNVPATKAAARTNLGLGTIATQNAASVAITGGTITGITDLAVADGGTGASTAQAAKTNLLIPPATQCQLDITGANLLMSRYGGSYLTINGVQEIIPAAGVQLAPTGTAVSTRYFIYAFMNAGTMTLEFSTTVPVADTTTGVQIKTSDATRTLVGQARTTSGGAWANTNTQRFVISYYNRRNLVLGPKPLAVPLGTFSNGTYIALAGGVTLMEFLSWGDEGVHFDFSGAMSTNVSNNTKTMISLDAANTDAYHEVSMSNVGATYSVNVALNATPASGYHTVEVYSQQNTVATATYTGSGTPGNRCAISGFVRG